MRGSISVKVSVVMLLVGLTGVALYATSPRAFKASVADTVEWKVLQNVPVGRQFEDFLALVPKDDGALVVGTGGTKMHVTTDDTFVDDTSGTMADLIAAHFRHPYLLISGLDYVGLNKFDGGGWQDLVSTPGAGNIYTTVYGTDDRVFFGQPASDPFGFNFVCYQPYDGSFGMCKMVTSKLMALTETSTGIRGVTKFGDFFEWSPDLTSETVVYDQPDDQQLDLVRAYFRESFRIQALNRLGPGSFDYRHHPGTSEGAWTVNQIPFTMDVLGLANDPGRWPFQNVTVAGSDTGSRARIYFSGNGGLTWEREAEDISESADNPLIDIATIPSADFGLMRVAVGNNGTVLVSPLHTIHADGFESADTSGWSQSFP